MNVRGLFISSLILALTACDNQPEEQPIFRSTIDGDHPIAIVMTDKLLTWGEQGGMPVGARRRMLEASIPILSRTWNPMAQGSVQIITVDLDDNTVMVDEDTQQGPCQKFNFSMWSVPGQPAIFVCPNYIFCRTETDTKTLYGPAGCIVHLMHELGHVLGAGINGDSTNPKRGHVSQKGRPLHGGGPVMAGWGSDSSSAALRDWTEDEDEPCICNEGSECEGGGMGGRCIIKMAAPAARGALTMPFIMSNVIGD